MTWNEPGGSRDKDPWGGPGKDQGPPDIDEVVKKLQDKLGGLFGGRGGRGGGSGVGKPGGLAGLIVGAVLVVWALSGIYIVDEGKRGVVMQFGAYHETTEPGLHWSPKLIQTVEIVDVENIYDEVIGDQLAEAIMLTQDENIVDIQFSIQYRINDPQAYLFNVYAPELTLRNAIESAVREVVGKSSWNTVTTEGRGETVAKVEALLQEILDQYRAGIQITSVNMQHAREPRQVREAFADVNKAREDAERMKNEAQAYSNDILPKARGGAARQVEEAEAYSSRVIAEAEGDATRFNKVLAEYNKAPRVTRERLYLETMEEIYAKSKKIVVDVKGGNSMFYLPLDQIMQQQRSRSGTSMDDMMQELPKSFNQPNESRPNRDTSRSRETR
ncbi:MAG: FtsH protease activity modulator HflK [Gammaproteobacteria bacterium]|nr:FtsH protease activity modulator HflK [Gammaproteobacteria bacterium]